MSASHPGSIVQSVYGTSGREVAMIEIADRCNENCLHCYQVQGQKGEMTTEEIFGLLDDLAQMGVLFLTVSGGEATLRSDLLEIIAHARKHRFVVDLFTNGLRMTRELASALADLHVRTVEISLYSSRPDIHDWITRVPGSFDKTVAGVRHLREFGVNVKLKSPLFGVTLPERRELEALAAELGANFTWDATLRAREDGDRTPESLQPAREQLDEFLEEVYPVHGALGRRDPGRAVCGACEGIHVEANGDLRPCAMLDVSLGDVREKSVGELMQGPEARFLRGLRWGNVPSCSRCDIDQACSRCHAQALHEVGDALAPYPSACAGALQQWESSSPDRGTDPGAWRHAGRSFPPAGGRSPRGFRARPSHRGREANVRGAPVAPRRGRTDPPPGRARPARTDQTTRAKSPKRIYPEMIGGGRATYCPGPIQGLRRG